MLVNFSPELIGAAVGTFLSVLFGWFPELNTWYAAKKHWVKSVIMLGLLLITSVTIYLLALYGVILTGEPITIIRLFTVLGLAIMQNQAIYTITPTSRKVLVIKSAIKAHELAVVSNIKPDFAEELVGLGKDAS